MTHRAADAATERDVDVDVVVVGSGFGGSVTALRLAEKGYRVLVLEAGQRFEDEDFAETSWDVRRYLWAPQVGCYGIQRIHRLPDVVVLAGAGTRALCPNHWLQGALPHAIDFAISGTRALRDHAVAAARSPAAPGGAGMSQHEIA